MIVEGGAEDIVTYLDDLDLDDRKGAFIFNVYGDSPAMKAGIQPGDLLQSGAPRFQRLPGDGEHQVDVHARQLGLAQGLECFDRLLR